jgi:ankyrin repeat protein
MTIEELQTIIDSTQWIFLQKGTYNRVSVSTNDFTLGRYTGPWVLKTPLSCDTALSESRRAVRKWNSLNPKYPAYRTKTGWIAPYLGNIPASDEQIANKLIDIYRQTRNIIFDAYVDNNFLLYNGEVICIDVDQSLRRGSIASDDWRSKNSLCFEQHLKRKSSDGYHLRIAVIETLLYLEEKLPEDKIKEEYITASMVAKLHNFRHEKQAITVGIMDTLLDIITFDSQSEIKDKYLTPLLINSLRSLRFYKKTTIKDEISSLINNQLLARALPSDLIKKGDLDDVRILIKHNSALLYQMDKDGLTLLHLAAMHDHPEIVRFLLAEGAQIDAIAQIDSSSVHSNRTALDLAICHGADAAAHVLLEAGATVSSAVCDTFAYLSFSAKNGLLDQVKLFIERDRESIHATNDCNQAALLWAASKGHHDIVAFLIAQGANVHVATQNSANPKHAKRNNYSPLDWAIQGGHTLTVLTLIKAGAVANRLHSTIKDKTLAQLIREGDFDSVQILINHNTALLNQMDKKGYTPLHYAARYGEIEIVRFLIAQGADLNAITTTAIPEYEEIGRPNMTALDIVLSLQDHDVVAIFLLELAAEVSPAVNGKYQAIHLAAKNGLLDLVKTLVTRDPGFIHATDSINQTPLLWAASRGHNEIVEFLIAQGADVHLATQRSPDCSYQGDYNHSPLDWAIKGNHTATAARLIKAGAVANVCTEDSKNERVIKSLIKLSLFQAASPCIDDDRSRKELVFD